MRHEFASPAGAMAFLMVSLILLSAKWLVQLLRIRSTEGIKQSHIAAMVLEIACTGVALMLYMDRVWVYDRSGLRSQELPPYDPVVPLSSNPNVIRAWQRVWCWMFALSCGGIFLLGMIDLVCLWLHAEDVKQRIILTTQVGELRKRASGFVVASMAAILLADVFLWSFAHNVSLFMLAAASMKLHDDGFAFLDAIRIALATVYIMAGLHKVNAHFLDDGLGPFLAEGALPHHSIFLWVVPMQQISCGILILLPYVLARRVAVYVSVLFHITVIGTSLFVGAPCNFFIPVNVLCIAVLLGNVMQTEMSSSEMMLAPNAKAQGGSSMLGRLSRGAIISFYALVFVVGPADNLLSTNPIWPGNAGWAFNMLDNNEVPDSLRIVGGAEPSCGSGGSRGMSKELPAQKQQERLCKLQESIYSDQRFFDATGPHGFLSSRLSIGDFEIKGGYWFLVSARRSNLKLAEWLATQFKAEVIVESINNQPFGVTAIKEEELAHHTWSCTPSCHQRRMTASTQQRLESPEDNLQETQQEGATEAASEVPAAMVQQRQQPRASPETGSSSTPISLPPRLIRRLPRHEKLSA